MNHLPVQCVVDASVGVKLVLNEADSVLAHDLFSTLDSNPAAVFWVPDLFYPECGNILWKLNRRGVLQAGVAEAHLKLLRGLNLQVLPSATLVEHALEIAIRFEVTVYDAVYVAASSHVQHPLITADDKLARKLAGSPFQVQLLASLAAPS